MLISSPDIVFTTAAGKMDFQHHLVVIKMSLKQEISID
jgi:hypothetical protein